MFVCSGHDTFSESYLLLVASVGPEALAALHDEYINGGTKESAAKKLARQRRLELGPSSSSSHGQGLSNAYPTSAIGMLGQK